MSQQQVENLLNLNETELKKYWHHVSVDALIKYFNDLMPGVLSEQTKAFSGVAMPHVLANNRNPMFSTEIEKQKQVLESLLKLLGLARAHIDKLKDTEESTHLSQALSRLVTFLSVTNFYLQAGKFKNKDIAIVGALSALALTLFITWVTLFVINVIPIVSPLILLTTLFAMVFSAVVLVAGAVYKNKQIRTESENMKIDAQKTMRMGALKFLDNDRTLSLGDFFFSDQNTVNEVIIENNSIQVKII